MDKVETYFAYDYGQLIGFTLAVADNVSVQPLFVQGTLIGPQRDAIVQKAQACDATHIFWLDSDMRFPKDALMYMLKHDVDIVGTNYCKRMPPYQPVATAEGMQFHTFEDSTGLVPVDHLGMGCMLTKVSVFKDMKLPIFPIGWSDEKEQYIGEDVAFQRKARLAGLTVYCDQDLSKVISHIGRMEFTHLHALDAAELAGRAAKGVAENGTDNELRDTTS
jgi:hypothetical protein